MNIYKERKNSRTRYERENNRAMPNVSDRKDRNSDTVEYTNMSSYERYRREKLAGADDGRYNSGYDNMRSYDDSYRYGYGNDDNMRTSRNDSRFDDYGRYSNAPRNDDRYYNGYGERRIDERDYMRDDRRFDNRRGDYDFYDYPRQDSFYDSRRDDRDNRPIRGGKKKSGLTLKCKFMIVVYFVIIAVITTLILINAVPNAKADSSYNDKPAVEINEENLYKTNDGSKIDIVDYVYDTETNSVKG